VTEHTKTYQKYLGEETHFIAYESGIRKAIELKKIKNGCPSYSELEVQLEMAKDSCKNKLDNLSRVG
jgi:hypothetical protein